MREKDSTSLIDLKDILLTPERLMDDVSSISHFIRIMSLEVDVTQTPHRKQPTGSMC